MRKILLFKLAVLNVLIAQEAYTELPSNYIREVKQIDASKAISLDLGYTSYALDIDADIFNRAIDYDLLELTVGMNFSYDKNWVFGAYYKGVVDEVQTNSIVDATGEKDSANVDRNEFLLTTTYKIPLNNNYDKEDKLSLHAIYYNSSLKSDNSFFLSEELRKEYNYKTQGLKISMIYALRPFIQRHKLWFNGGMVYTQAKLDFKEYASGDLKDTYVEDKVNLYGVNFGAGYSNAVNTNMSIKAIADWYGFNAEEIDISSRTQGSLTKGTFNEQTYSLRLGVAYSF
jgi:hypothetical protein